MRASLQATTGSPALVSSRWTGFVRPYSVPAVAGFGVPRSGDSTTKVGIEKLHESIVMTLPARSAISEALRNNVTPVGNETVGDRVTVRPSALTASDFAISGPVVEPERSEIAPSVTVSGSMGSLKVAVITPTEFATLPAAGTRCEITGGVRSTTTGRVVLSTSSVPRRARARSE